MSLAGLGYFAGGMAQGIERGQAVRERQKRLEMDREQQDWRRSEFDRQAELANRIRAAQQAGADVFAADRQAYESQYANPLSGPPQEGQDAVQAAPMAPWEPNDELRLKAVDATSDALFSNGLLSEGAQVWGLAETQRKRLRGSAGQALMAALESGEDVTEPMKRFYRLVGDGSDITAVHRITGPGAENGEMVVQRNNRLTGQPMPDLVATPDQVIQTVGRMLADPETVAKQSMEAYMASLKEALQLKRELAVEETRLRGQRENEAAKDERTRQGKAEERQWKLEDLPIEEDIKARSQMRVQGASAAATGVQQRLTDAAKAKLEVGGLGKPPTDYRWDPNNPGAAIPIPGGPADVKREGIFNADIAARDGTITALERLESQVDLLAKHPGLKSIVGLRGVMYDPPGSDGADARSILNTLKTQTMMALQQELRVNARTTTGGQARYSAELAKKLESGVASLDPNQSPAQFKGELVKLRKWAQDSKKKVAETYNAKYPESPPPTATQPLPGNPPAPGPGLSNAPQPPAPTPGAGAAAPSDQVLYAKNRQGVRIMSRNGGPWEVVR
jgi:hypothetical protein